MDHWDRVMKKMSYFAKYPIIIALRQSKDDQIKECPSISLNIQELPLAKKRPR